MTNLRVRAACKRRLVQLATHAFDTSEFVAHLTATPSDPDHVLYFGAAEGPTDPDSLEGDLATDTFTIPARIESHKHFGEECAAEAEAAVEEAFNLFEQTLKSTVGMDHPDVPSEMDGGDPPRPVYRPASKPRIIDVNGPAHYRHDDVGEAIGVLEFTLKFRSNLS